jgi:hypothetical protein
MLREGEWSKMPPASSSTTMSRTLLKSVLAVQGERRSANVLDLVQVETSSLRGRTNICRKRQPGGCHQAKEAAGAAGLRAT